VCAVERGRFPEGFCGGRRGLRLGSGGGGVPGLGGQIEGLVLGGAAQHLGNGRRRPAAAQDVVDEVRRGPLGGPRVHMRVPPRRGQGAGVGGGCEADGGRQRHGRHR